MESDPAQLNLNPQFIYKGPSKFTNSEESVLSSNYYGLHIKKGYNQINQYSLDSEPQVPEDSPKQMDKLIRSIFRELKEKIGLICTKGKMLWGSKQLKIVLAIKTEVDGQSYEINIKPNTTISVEEFITKDKNNLDKFSQVCNINTKNVLAKIGFKELDRGKFYCDEDFNQDVIHEAGLSVWRGYQVNICNIANKLYLKADVCSRVLRVETFLETMKKTNKIKQKRYINDTFVGTSVITRYGKHRMIRIEEVVYDMTPESTFQNHKDQKKQTFTEYYKTNYQVTIKEKNQPLLRFLARNGDKVEDQYVIPEMVSMTGLTDEQRADFRVMKAVDEKTKLRVDERIKDTDKIIRMLNNSKNKDDLMYSLDEKPQQFPGTVVGAPRIYLGNRTLEPSRGAFNMRDKLKDPIKLKNFYFVYSRRNGQDDQDADATIDFLKNASKSYGIQVGKPCFIEIDSNKKRPTANDWIKEIENQNKQGMPQFVILYFNMQEKKDKNLYEQLKKHLIHSCQLNSQVITKKTLSAGAKGGMSKASKILLQINDKLGHPLYTVEKQHPFWKKNTIAISGMAVSKGVKGFTASFVGTRSNDSSLHFSDFRQIQSKESIPKAILSDFMVNWLKEYYKSEKKQLPSTILLYREGLNEKQANKVLTHQIQAFQQAFELVSTKAKIQNYKPKFIYMLVNQKTGTRMYQMDKNKYYSNPLPGTIIGSELSKDNSYEFLMASTTTDLGTTNLVQYKVAYDSSNQEVPHEAVKIITYEECYNYPNWAGSIRFPSCLQKANKLAKFVSSHGTDRIDKENPLKKLDYYI